MLTRLRKHFTYANVALTLALVFAMSGGAYAAGKYLITSTKQISPKVLKQLAGKTGTTGATGPAGLAGPVGPAGASGGAGKEGGIGKEGPVGKEGPQGKPGTAGTAGKEGSPWAAGGTLPSGKSEYGAWSTNYVATAADQLSSSAISFTIPLNATPEAHYIAEGELPGGNLPEAPALKEGKCSVSVEKRGAAPGNLCVFANSEFGTIEYLYLGQIPVRFFENSSSGAVVAFGSTEAGNVSAYGTWVVTAP